MGLDMYLYRRSYVKRWDHQSESDRHQVTVFKGDKPRRDIQTDKIVYVVEEVAYWRKANAIHKWFVENCQDGVDDCRDEAAVTIDNLKKLITECETVLSTVETIEGDILDGRTYYPNGKVVDHSHRGPVVAQKHIAENRLPTQGGFFFGNTEYDEHYLDDLRKTVAMLTPVVAAGAEFGVDLYYHSSW